MAIVGNRSTDAWFGTLPSHWSWAPLKYLVAFTSGGTPSKENIAYWDGEVPWASSKDLKVERLDDSQDHTTQFAVDEGAATLVRDGSILIVVRGMILAHSFPVTTITRPMAINQDLKALWPRATMTSEYLAWLLRGATAATLSLIDEAGHGTKVVRMDKWTSMPVPVPPMDEQTAIAAFLDRETAKIDALVAEQERLMALLREKRQAVVSHAVTKGLYPDAPMRASAIEWLGDVPAHWGIVPLKRVATVRTGVAKGKDNGGKRIVTVPYLRVANVQDGYLDLETIATMDVPAEDLDRLTLRPGDVLMNEGGDFDKLGRGHIWEGQIDPCITQNHVFAVRPHGVSSEWLNAFTGSHCAQFYFMTRSKQSTNLASISSTNLMELPVILPPATEQASILEFVSRETQTFDVLCSEAERSRLLLLERRAAIISAAVTGQIDVRHLVTADAA